MRDSSVKPSSSIRNHMNWKFGLISKSIIVGAAPDSTRPGNRLREHVPLLMIFKKKIFFLLTLLKLKTDELLFLQMVHY